LITDPYLLVLNIPLQRHQGEFWAEPLWKKDLEAHLTQISSLSIACPVRDGPPPDDWVQVDGSRIRVHPLPAMGRLAPLKIPYLAVRLWHAIGAAAIVHTGVAGWPFPLGWLAAPLARLRNRFLVIVVESAFWRVPPGAKASSVARARALLLEAVNKACVRACDAAFFTTRAYRDVLHPGGRGAAHVLPAVWVDDAQLIGPDRLAALRPAKGAKLLFAGRLSGQKGVGVLLDAVARSGVPVDIVGDGELRGDVLEAHRRRPDLVRLIAPVAYGRAFSDLLDTYAALVVPTVSDEQPRVVYDAFARGLSVLASATTGNRQIVTHGREGLLYEPDDAEALAAVLVEATSDPARLHEMGATALGGMATQTHAAMHAARAGMILETFKRDGFGGTGER